MKRIVSPIESDRLTLRLIEASDLEMTRMWQNQDGRRWFFSDKVIEPEAHRAWFADYRQRDDDFVFIAECSTTVRPIAQVSLYGIDWIRGGAECGRLIVGRSKDRGHGYGREAIAATVGAGFRNWALNEIVAEIKTGNVASVNAFSACGFKSDPADSAEIVRMHATPATFVTFRDQHARR